MLWWLLSSSNERDLLRAFDEETIAKTPKSLTICTLATTEEKRSAISHWEQFPLQSVDDVQNWMKNFDENTEHLLTQTPIRDEPDTARHSWGHTEESRPDYLEPDMTEQYDSQRESHDTLASSERNSIVSLARAELHPSRFRLEAAESQVPLFAEGPQLNQSAVARKFGLSTEFQDTFLW